VLDEEQLDPEGIDDDQPTDVGERFECPVCGAAVPGVDFRVEAAGEVWTGDAAVWAEEGVCSGCYREVISKNVREWTSAEWLVHHYEGWHRMTLSAHDILVFEHSPQEGWLLEEDRHRILDVEGTLAARREHLARCQMAMKKLQERYDSTSAAPPFQMSLASASAALSEAVVDDLRLRREADLTIELELRRVSVYGIAPVVGDEPDEDDVPTRPGDRAGSLPGAASSAAVGRPQASSSMWLVLAAVGVVVVLVVVVASWLH
jgi:predicted nucleic acid-binding Zn ribbon protein